MRNHHMLFIFRACHSDETKKFRLELYDTNKARVLKRLRGIKRNSEDSNGIKLIKDKDYKVVSMRGSCNNVDEFTQKVEREINLPPKPIAPVAKFILYRIFAGTLNESVKSFASLSEAQNTAARVLARSLRLPKQKYFLTWESVLQDEAANDRVWKDSAGQFMIVAEVITH